MDVQVLSRHPEDFPPLKNVTLIAGARAIQSPACHISVYFHPSQSTDVTVTCHQPRPAIERRVICGSARQSISTEVSWRRRSGHDLLNWSPAQVTEVIKECGVGRCRPVESPDKSVHKAKAKHNTHITNVWVHLPILAYCDTPTWQNIMQSVLRMNFIWRDY